jgi:site-specific DNA recombinase
MTNRAAIYLRQSQDRSGKEEGIERQRARCLSLAKLRGWEVVEEYVDNDTSATKRRGPGTAWHKLVGDAEAGRVDIIVAVDQDRLLRGLRDLVTLIDLGLKVVTVDGEIDLASADGEFRATMAAGLARFEGRRKAERMRRANEQRRDKGVPTSGRVPYGYKWIPSAERERRRDPAAYELDGERAEVVRDIYKAALGGVPIRSIARDLTLAGHRTLPTRARPDGVPLRPSTINRMLLSPYYAALLPIPKEGATKYDQKAITRESCVEGNWPPPGGGHHPGRAGDGC